MVDWAEPGTPGAALAYEGAEYLTEVVSRRIRSVRVDDALWNRFSWAARCEESSMSEILRSLILLYVRLAERREFPLQDLHDYVYDLTNPLNVKHIRDEQHQNKESGE